MPLKSASFSAAEALAAMRLNAFHSAAQPMPILSTGKLLSNMQRSAPNSSMHGSMYGRQSAASSIDVGGFGCVR